MTVDEFKEKLSQYPDDMELDEDDPSLFTVEEYKHPVRGWETLAHQDDVEARIRKEFPIRKKLVIRMGY